MSIRYSERLAKAGAEFFGSSYNNALAKALVQGRTGHRRAPWEAVELATLNRWPGSAEAEANYYQFGDTVDEAVFTLTKQLS